MKKTILRYSFSALALLLLASAPLSALEGSGTEAEPYIINNADDWNSFADDINAGINAEAYYMLSDDFENAGSPVTESHMAGNTESRQFKGKFNGNGRTLTVNISTSEKYAAPFRHVSNAAIQNLTVEGSITSSEMHAGGFIAHVNSGSILIENCVSKVTVTGTISGDGTHAGFIGLSESGTSVEFLDCLFCGKLLGSNTNSSSGFLGWKRGTSTYVNCLFAPEEVTMSASRSAVFNRNGVNSITNCYYTKVFGEVQGTDAKKMTDTELAGLLGKGWELRDGKATPIQGKNLIFRENIKGLEPAYVYNGREISLEYTVTQQEHTLVKGTDYTEKIIDSDGNPVTSLISKGHYALVITGIGECCGSKSLSFIVRFGGKGTAEEPYVIENTVEWNDFSALVNSSDSADYKNSVCVISADLDFNGVAGAFKRIGSFGGVIDGNYHSISGVCGYANGVVDNLESGGIIKNLTLKNTVLQERGYCGGIAGINHGTVINCHVAEDVYIYSTDSPQSGENKQNFCHGGLSGDNYGVIEGCTSGATVMQKHGNNHYYGGIAGINRSGGTLRNCFYYGKKVHAAGSRAAICGYNYGAMSLCLHTYPDYSPEEPFPAANGNSTGASYAYSLTIKTKGVSLNPASSTNYGKITVFFGCILFNGILYAPTGLDMSLDLVFTNTEYDKKYIACDYKYKNGSQTVISTCAKDPDGKYSFRMPASDVEFYAGYEWEGEGTEENPYVIENLWQMDFLSVRVNSLEKTYTGKHFVLKNDIAWNEGENNYSVIGGYCNGVLSDFSGVFDGKGHSLSGIRVTRDATDESGKYTGVFGRIGTGGYVKNFILKNTIIKGCFASGGISGYNAGTIENCTVEESVSVLSECSISSCHGGITGYNAGIVKKCTSYAGVSDSTCAGGITGYCKEGTVSECIYYASENSDVTASDSFKGYIAGHFAGGTLKDNFYVGEELYALGGASYGHDSDGAERPLTISSLECNPVFAEGSEGFVYNSKLYALKGSAVKLSLESYVPQAETLTGLCAADGTDRAFVFESQKDGVYEFTMPDYDVLVTSLVKIEFNTYGGTLVPEQLIVKGGTAKPVEAPVVSSDKVFEDWYANPEFTELFDFSGSVNKSLTLYAKYSTGINLEAKEDAFSSGVFYTTFYSSKTSYKVDSNSKVFYATKKSDGKLCIEEELSGIINAGKGVIIKSSSPVISLVLTSLKGSYPYGNILTGTDSEIAAPKGTYIMGFNKKGGIGFYGWNGKISANKAFIITEEN